nr:ATP-binding protein [Actinoplanes solisilvae]
MSDAGDPDRRAWHVAEAAMSPDESVARFDRLWRGRDTAGTAGSGIGLAVVRELVTTHGGAVGIDSPASGGVTVTIRLPTAAPLPPRR